MNFEERHKDLIRLRDQLRKELQVYKPKGSNITFAHSISDIPNDKRTEIFSIVETNMKPIYEASSWGWDGSKKLAEVESGDNHYLLIKDNTTHDITGLLIFQISVEPSLTADSPKDNDGFSEELVAYIMELQIRAQHQKRGIGSALLNELECIIASTHQNVIKKIMLTVFNSNVSAINFYTKHGFVDDETSPSVYLDAEEAENFDYKLMRKYLD